jgi:hypothetical protein
VGAENAEEYDITSNGLQGVYDHSSYFYRPAFTRYVFIMKLLSQIILVLLCTCVSAWCGAQQVRFEMPLKGRNGCDFFICRFVDHDAGKGILDAYCGTMTYDGHKGTDFLIRSFKTMDSGVYVYAVADGVVFQVEDWHYDRMKTLDISASPNSIGINHKDKLRTYYYHLVKNSAMVQPGDSVRAGQPIGRVGSSGYSTSPHLHLEIVDSNRHIVDPFIGYCSQHSSPIWYSEPQYDTSLYLIEDGFIPYIPQLDSLQERYLVSDTFDIGSDPVVCHWVLVHDLRKGSQIKTQWFGPSGLLWGTYSFVWDGAEAYAYSWSYMKAPKFKGKWTSKFFVDGRLIAERKFFMRRIKHK